MIASCSMDRSIALWNAKKLKEKTPPLKQFQPGESDEFLDKVILFFFHKVSKILNPFFFPIAAK